MSSLRAGSCSFLCKVLALNTDLGFFFLNLRLSHHRDHGLSWWARLIFAEHSVVHPALSHLSAPHRGWCFYYSLSPLSLGGLGLDVIPSTVAAILFLVQGWSHLQQREWWRMEETWVFSVINQPWNPQNSRLPVQWDNCLSCGRILDSFRFFVSMETKCKSSGFRGQTQN